MSRDSDDLVARLIDGDDLKCAWRGCGETGLHYLRTVNSRGRASAGMYCDEHEEQEGDKNMARAEKHSRRLAMD